MRNRLIPTIAALTAAALMMPNGASAQQQVPTTVIVGQGRTLTVGSQQHGAGVHGQVPPGWEVREGRANAQFLSVDGRTVGMAMTAIETQETYACKRCGSVLVCSVRPTCEE